MENNFIKPFILYENKNSVSDLETLKKDYPIWKLNDVYENQLKEFFEILHPSSKFSSDYSQRLVEFIKKKNQSSKMLSGNWIYFPWSGELVHTLNEDDYFALRTNRNRNLIIEEEQKKLSIFTVGIAGLSIGSQIALNLAYLGMSNSMHLADYDILETTNLNRVQVKLSDIGFSKIELASRQIYDINPYAELLLWSNGLNKININNFICAHPIPRLIFEAIDDFEMKIRIRLVARKAGIPVIMLTNLGDQLLVDVERYDIDKNLPIFNGFIGNLDKEILKQPLTEEARVRYAKELVSVQNIPKKALDSLLEINKTLVGRPQLMSTVAIGAGAAAYLAKRIALGEMVPSGRKLVKFQEIFHY